jgi:hypothetical protein
MGTPNSIRIHKDDREGNFSALGTNTKKDVLFSALLTMVPYLKALP